MLLLKKVERVDVSDPVFRKSRIPHWGWWLVATVLIVLPLVGIRLWAIERQAVIVGEIDNKGITIASGGLLEHLAREYASHEMSRWARASRSSVGLLYEDHAYHLPVKEVHGFSFWETAYGARTPQTDDDLLPLAGVTNLTLLLIDGDVVPKWHITDEGMNHVAKLSSLRWLYLRGVEITDEGLSQLKALRSLEGLDLARTPITDAGLTQLSGLANLKWLHLPETRITDIGLLELIKLPNLNELDVTGTQVTSSGAARLKSAMSGTTIIGP